MTEVKSKSQRIEQLDAKLVKMEMKLPDSMKGGEHITIPMEGIK